MKLKRLLENPYRIFSVLANRGHFQKMEDEKFIRWQYRAQMGKWLDWEDLSTFNEKLQWLKLHDRRPEYTTMVDKLLVRDYIARTIGAEYLIPLLGAWDDPEDIDFDALPEQFVLKCNHNSGLGMCICKDKSKLDIQKVKQELKRGLAQDYYLASREWPYKNVPRKIICEQFMSNGGRELEDYKVHNFNGQPKMILVCRDRFAQTGLTEDFFTPDWEHLPLKRPKIPNGVTQTQRPEQLEEMLALSKVLAKDIPFVRTDFYVIEGKVYFGEITFFPASGLSGFEPQIWDETFGAWLELPKETIDGV